MAWISKTKNKIAVIFGALILAGALFGVIWGVTHHSEPGLLKVCWNGAEVEYVSQTEVYSDPCTTPWEDLVYEKRQIPLTVVPMTYGNNSILSPDDRDSKVVDAVVRDINAQFGFELFKMVYGSDAVQEDGRIKASVIVHTQAAYTPGERALSVKVSGWAIHSRRSDGSTQCDVYIRGGLSERYMYRVGIHELGHVIGFAHDDDNPGSVMFPLTTDDTTIEHMLPSRFTDSDTEMGRQLYYGGDT